MTDTGMTHRLYRAHGKDRVAVLSVAPAWAHVGMFTVHVLRGARRTMLSESAAYGPFARAEAEQHVAQIVASLRAEGFTRGGVPALLAALASKSSRKRALAARRLGWMRESDAVEGLLAALEKADDDRSAIVDALGRIGDARAVSAVAAEAERKLLSRRRSGVEALWNLREHVSPELGAAVDARALERLPAPVRLAVDECAKQPTFDEGVQHLADAISAVDLKDRGLVIDTVYELRAPHFAAAAVRVLAGLKLGQPHVWRYARSVFKRAMLRGDHAAFAFLAHAIEVEGRSHTGTTATVKSGYDGETRKVRIFGRATQDYFRRAAWRHLRALAQYRPEQYPLAAAEVLARYTPGDAQEPRKLYGAYAGCYLLHRILWGMSHRFVLNARRMRFKYVNAASTAAPANVREEAYWHLWDAFPRAYLRVLAGASLPEVQEWALAALRRGELKVLREASHEEVAALLASPYEPTVQLGLEELRRRFDPSNPDWSLLEKLLGDGRAPVRALGLEWVGLTAPLWTREPARTLAFLTVPDAQARARVAQWAVEALRAADGALRAAHATGLVDLLRGKETPEGAHEGAATVVREALLAEAGALLATPEVLAWLSGGSSGARAVAAEILGHRPEVLHDLGMARVVVMAGDPAASVRRAAQALLRGGVTSLRQDPSVLFALVESEWEDTRQAAFAILRDAIGFESLGAAGILGLCDSNRPDVQKVGQALVVKHFAELDPHELITKLSQHPDPKMRAFVLGLVVDHLKEGFVSLAKLEDFFRSVLFDLWPDARVKRTLLDFLATRGLRDEHQAEVAARILGEYVRTQTRADFERVMLGLVQIRMAFPHVASPVTLREQAAPTHGGGA